MVVFRIPNIVLISSRRLRLEHLDPGRVWLGRLSPCLRSSGPGKPRLQSSQRWLNPPSSHARHEASIQHIRNIGIIAHVDAVKKHPLPSLAVSGELT